MLRAVLCVRGSQDAAGTLSCGPPSCPRLLCAVWQDKAAKQGEVEALISLAILLLDGSYYEPTCRVAHRALKLAGERGPWGQIVKEGYDAYAQGDEIGAFVRYRIAAELGYRTAQANLAWLYEHGVPPYVARDYRAAQGYYQRAAAQGDVPSQRRLGDLYYYGLVDVTPDMALAFQVSLLAVVRWCSTTCTRNLCTAHGSPLRLLHVDETGLYRVCNNYAHCGPEREQCAR